jgi:hypothetical protein
MAYEISRADVWVGEVEDRPGGLATKLEVLRDAGANLEFMVVRRSAQKKGTARLYVSPLRGAAALKAEMVKTTQLFTVRIEGQDRPGLSARIARTMGDAGVNMHGFSGATLGERNVIYIAFDSMSDANRATAALNRALAEAQFCS